MALNGVGLEQEQRRDSVEGRRLRRAHHLQEGFQQELRFLFTGDTHSRAK